MSNTKTHTTQQSQQTEKKTATSISILNRKASHDFAFEKEFNAGIKLLGSEVKSIRKGDATIADSYCYINNGEIFVKGMHIAEFKDAAVQHDPTRDRKLLLTKDEIEEIEVSISQKGYTIIVQKIYNKKGLIKVKLQLAKGKKDWDQREDLKRKDIERQLRRGDYE